MIARLICWLKGHKRGKRAGMATSSNGATYIDFRCPRCGEVWTRKDKSRAVTA